MALLIAPQTAQPASPGRCHGALAWLSPAAKLPLCWGSTGEGWHSLGGCPKSLEGCHQGSLLLWALLGAQQGAGWARARWAEGAAWVVGEEMLRAGSSAADMAVGLSCSYRSWQRCRGCQWSLAVYQEESFRRKGFFWEVLPSRIC